MAKGWEKWEKEGKNGEKWLKVGNNGEKWRKVAKSWKKWGNLFTKWSLAAILDDRLAISDQYATFFLEFFFLIFAKIDKDLPL